MFNIEIQLDSDTYCLLLNPHVNCEVFKKISFGIYGPLLKTSRTNAASVGIVQLIVH